MNKLVNKTALITGAMHSIGLAIAETFLAEGAQVILTGRKAYAEGKQFASQLGSHADYLNLDVSHEEDWMKAKNYLKEKYGKLDILVNNAGIEYPRSVQGLQDPENCTLSDWKEVHEVNLDGVFLGCKYAIALMKRQQNCSIVNIGSRSALVGVATSAAYSSSKGAVRNYTKTVAAYCAQKSYSIRCNAVHPAAILTKMWDKELGTDANREKRVLKFSEGIPLKRMGTPNEVAQAVLYLASDDSKFVTGTEIIIDGGIMACSSASANEDLISLD